MRKVGKHFGRRKFRIGIFWRFFQKMKKSTSKIKHFHGIFDENFWWNIFRKIFFWKIDPIESREHSELIYWSKHWPAVFGNVVYDHKTLGDRWARTESRLARTWAVWPARVTSQRGFAAILASGPCTKLICMNHTSYTTVWRSCRRSRNLHDDSPACGVAHLL